MAGGALSHLDEALVALCDGDYAEDLLAIDQALAGRTSLSTIAAAIARATSEIRQARERLVGSNVKPAPFCLNERTVGDLIAASEAFEPAVKLVDRPRRSEDPRLARANDNTPAAPAESPVIEPAPEPFPSPDIGDAPAPGEHDAAPQMAPPEPEDIDAQRAFERASLGQEPRPVRAAVHKGASPRIEIIEAAAKKLREAQETGRDQDCPPARSAPVRVRGGASARFRTKTVQRASEKRAAGSTLRREAKTFPPLPFEQRRARLQAAETFLKQRGLLVTVVDRNAQVRTYRVTGEKGAMLAEQVIGLAIGRGLDA